MHASLGACGSRAPHHLPNLTMHIETYNDAATKLRDTSNRHMQAGVRELFAGRARMADDYMQFGTYAGRRYIRLAAHFHAKRGALLARIA